MASRASPLQEGPFLAGKYTKKGHRTRTVQMRVVRSWTCLVLPAAPMDQGLRDIHTDRKYHLKKQVRMQIIQAYP